jgi:hypothetical protein
MTTVLASNPLDLWRLFAVLEPKPKKETLDEYLHRSEGTLLSNDQLTVLYAQAAKQMHTIEVSEWTELAFQHQRRIGNAKYDETNS